MLRKRIESMVTVLVLTGVLLLSSGLFLDPVLADPIADRLRAVEQQLFEIRSIRESLAEQTAAVGRLQEELAQLRGSLEELRHQVRSGAAGSLPSNLESRLARIEAALGLATAGGGSGPTPTVPGSGTTVAAPATTAPPAPVTEDGVFNQAKGLYKQGKMAQARETFQKFIADYPASNKVPAAKFWIGETFYYQKRFEESVLEYQKVIQDHPKSDKVPAAMLKQAFAFAEIKDATSARVILKRLIKAYPKSQQAVIAKKKLALIK